MSGGGVWRAAEGGSGLGVARWGGVAGRGDAAVPEFRGLWERVVPEIIFIEANGARHKVQAAVGASVMRAAVMNDIEGILAECGGAAACATCHVLLAPHAGLPPLSTIEDDMLDSTAVPRQAGSRLGCQVIVTAELEGLEVHLPETQL